MSHAFWHIFSSNGCETEGFKVHPYNLNRHAIASTFLSDVVMSTTPPPENLLETKFWEAGFKDLAKH